MIQLKSTSDIASDGMKVLVYGQAGAGKTSLIPTLPSPVVLSAEGGLLSISQHNIPYIEISTLDDLAKAYQWLTGSEEARQFQSVALDSISEVAEVVLESSAIDWNRSEEHTSELQSSGHIVSRRLLQ